MCTPETSPRAFTCSKGANIKIIISQKIYAAFDRASLLQLGIFVLRQKIQDGSIQVFESLYLGYRMDSTVEFLKLATVGDENMKIMLNYLVIA